mgnify:CR=1 FL=1
MQMRVCPLRMRGVQEMGAKGQVSFKDLREAIRLMTIEGGFAHKGMEKLSKTLNIFSTPLFYEEIKNIEKESSEY